MPVQDGNYVAPEWVNGQPPAINASELNDISETLESDWRREQVLTPNTAQVFGLDGSATPDQVFSKIAQQFGKTVNVTVTLDGSPISGVTVKGITTEDGGACITNNSGKTSGVCATSSTTLTAVSNWLDVDSVSQVIDTSAVQTNATLDMTSKSSGKVEITTSKTVRFSPARKSIQGFAVGGGASGSAASVNYNNGYDYDAGIVGGSGGGHFATFTITQTSVTRINDIVCVIGQGGASVQASYSQSGYGEEARGASGGETSVSINGGTTTYTASGGFAGECKINLDMGNNNYTKSTGGNGGSGGGGALAYPSGGVFTGAGGTNGNNGDEARYSNSIKASGGSGQGNGEGTFDGVVYGSGSGGASLLTYNNIYSQKGNSRAGRSVVNAIDGSNYGDAGGSIASCYTGVITSGAGKQGVVIFKWTT